MPNPQTPNLTAAQYLRLQIAEMTYSVVITGIHAAVVLSEPDWLSALTLVITAVSRTTMWYCSRRRRVAGGTRTG